MENPIKELNVNVGQIVFHLRENDKIMHRHKEWICDMLDRIINSKIADEKDLEVFKTLKDIDRKKLIKMPVFDNLNHEYVRLSDWYKANQGLKVPSKERAHIEGIMAQINNFKEYTDEEISAFHDNSDE